MSQMSFSIRMDEDTKNMMNEICDSLGISMSSAFNVFAKAFVREGGFPFDVRLGKNDDDGWNAFLEARNILKKKNLTEPTLEEIENEIKAIRSRKEA